MHNIISKEGFDYRFDPSKCAACEGKCCTGESGYIWLTPAEMEQIAAFLQMDTEDFKTTCLRKVRYRYSLKERLVDGSYECIFFDEVHRNCSIYPVRPSQCATFPFWDYFKDHIEEVVEECPGIVLPEK